MMLEENVTRKKEFNTKAGLTVSSPSWKADALPLFTGRSLGTISVDIAG